jgi:hypothetical protein
MVCKCVVSIQKRPRGVTWGVVGSRAWCKCRRWPNIAKANRESSDCFSSECHQQQALAKLGLTVVHECDKRGRIAVTNVGWNQISLSTEWLESECNSKLNGIKLYSNLSWQDDFHSLLRHPFLSNGKEEKRVIFSFNLMALFRYPFLLKGHFGLCLSKHVSELNNIEIRGPWCEKNAFVIWENDNVKVECQSLAF